MLYRDLMDRLSLLNVKKGVTSDPKRPNVTVDTRKEEVEEDESFLFCRCGVNTLLAKGFSPKLRPSWESVMGCSFGKGAAAGKSQDAA